MRLQVKTSLERCTEFFFYRYYYLLYTVGGREYMPSSCHSTTFYGHDSSGGARDALLARRGVPNEWCLRVRVFYHLDFFLKRPPILVHEPRRARARLWRRVRFFFF